MRKCPKCSLIHDDSVMKCTYCGYDFTEEDAVVDEQTVDTAPVADTPSVEPVVSEPAPQNEPVFTAPVQDNGNNNNYAPYGAPQVKYCPRCGNACDPKAVICVKCGMAFENFNPVVEEDKPSTALKVLCVLFPVIALILYCVYKKTKPISAKEYGKWGLIGLAINVALQIVSVVLNLFAYGVTDTYDDFDYYYTIFSNFITMLK